jgi:CheY-like chemotaxis protein
VTRNVLIVEDDADVREMIQLVLESEGYPVVTAPNGAAALDVLQARGDEVGLILLDCLMPVMDGWTFLDKRSHSPSLKRVPTVMLSAVQPTHPMIREASGFLAKPVDVDALLAVVSRHVGQA